MVAIRSDIATPHDGPPSCMMFTSCPIRSSSSLALPRSPASSSIRCACGGRSTAGMATSPKAATRSRSRHPSATTAADVARWVRPAGALMPAGTAFGLMDAPVWSYAVVAVISRPIAPLGPPFTLNRPADEPDLAPSVRLDGSCHNGNRLRRDSRSRSSDGPMHCTSPRIETRWPSA